MRYTKGYKIIITNKKAEQKNLYSQTHYPYGDEHTLRTVFCEGFNKEKRIRMKKIKILLGITILTMISVISCGKTTEECKGDIRAYEFGREMATYSDLSNLSLSKSIEEYSVGIGIEHPYEANNPCVITGFDDEKNKIESPYNKDGKSWTSF